MFQEKRQEMTREITQEERDFFASQPAAWPLYETLNQRMEQVCPPFTVQVHKTQITFRARYGFASVSLRRMKGCPPVFFIPSFGLPYAISSQRLAMVVEPYPQRFTHHMLISREDQLDEEVMEWLRQACHFALVK